MNNNKFSFTYLQIDGFSLSLPFLNAFLVVNLRSFYGWKFYSSHLVTIMLIIKRGQKVTKKTPTNIISSSIERKCIPQFNFISYMTRLWKQKYTELDIPFLSANFTKHEFELFPYCVKNVTFTMTIHEMAKKGRQRLFVKQILSFFR